jgi:hypothetical protein
LVGLLRHEIHSKDIFQEYVQIKAKDEVFLIKLNKNTVEIFRLWLNQMVQRHAKNLKFCRYGYEMA